MQDVDALRTITNRPIAEEPVATSGHNWGHLAVDGSTLVFKVGGRAAFSVPLPDVSQAQQGREEVMLEFPLDDTSAGAQATPHHSLGCWCAQAGGGVHAAVADGLAGCRAPRPAPTPLPAPQAGGEEDTRVEMPAQFTPCSRLFLTGPIKPN